MFWSLTVREFLIKHRAFARAEDRQRSHVVTLAAMIGQYKDNDRRKLDRYATELRRYPLKKWLLPNASGD